jgi:hypothetical protein
MAYDWRKHFTPTADRTAMGPRAVNPTYTVTSAKGAAYLVKRHQWVLPTTRWAWAARPVAGGKTVYADTLEDLAYDLGLIQYEEEVQ